MKESHFELPRSQYMESHSHKSHTSKPCYPQQFDFTSENGDTNEGSAFPFSSPKKIVSWDLVLQECDMNTAGPGSYCQPSTLVTTQPNIMPAYRFFPNSFEESASLQYAGSPNFDGPLSCGGGSPQQPHPLLPGMNSVMSFLLRGDSLGGATTAMGSNYSP